MDNKELIKKYIEILKKGNEPLYPHEVKNIKKELEDIELILDEKIVNDLIFLNDKDLCIKYDLDPRVLSSKYLNVEIEDIKSSLKRLDIVKMRNNFKVQYDEFDKRGWL